MLEPVEIGKQKAKHKDSEALNCFTTAISNQLKGKMTL
jgi:hypothetical protein